MVDMDPELEAFIPLFPRADLTDPIAERKSFAALAASVPASNTTDMEIEDRTVPADPDVAVRIYHPHPAQGAIVRLHGGGFVMGDLDTEHPAAARVADGSGAVVISVGYRLAPEHRFPAALDDAYAVLTWAAEHAAELGIDRERIAVGGHSSGAGLAAAVALRARDQQGPLIRFQLLIQPGLDDRQETWSARNFTDTPLRTFAHLGIEEVIVMQLGEVRPWFFETFPYGADPGRRRAARPRRFRPVRVCQLSDSSTRAGPRRPGPDERVDAQRRNEDAARWRPAAGR
jgi:acetyl esterase/lipase